MTFKQPSVVLTADVFHFDKKYSINRCVVASQAVEEGQEASGARYILSGVTEGFWSRETAVSLVPR